MKLIGIDSSGLVASVAIMEDDKLVAEYTVNNRPCFFSPKRKSGMFRAKRNIDKVQFFCCKS